MLLPRGEEERDQKGKMAHWDTQSDREEIMKSGKEFKSRRNQGEKIRGERDTGKTLNEREMGS